jgi:hypothetical protein
LHVLRRHGGIVLLLCVERQPHLGAMRFQALVYGNDGTGPLHAICPFDAGVELASSIDCQVQDGGSPGNASRCSLDQLVQVVILRALLLVQRPAAT